MHEDLSLTAVKKSPCTVPRDKGQRLYFPAHSRNARGILADRWMHRRQVFSAYCAFDTEMMTTLALMNLHLRLRGNFRTIHVTHRANITSWYYADIDSHQRSLLGVLDLLNTHLFFDSLNLMGWTHSSKSFLQTLSLLRVAQYRFGHVGETQTRQVLRDRCASHACLYHCNFAYHILP